MEDYNDKQLSESYSTIIAAYKKICPHVNNLSDILEAYIEYENDFGCKYIILKANSIITLTYDYSLLTLKIEKISREKIVSVEDEPMFKNLYKNFIYTRIKIYLENGQEYIFKYPEVSYPKGSLEVFLDNVRKYKNVVNFIMK